MPKRLSTLFVSVTIGLVTGCGASYVTPGRGASLERVAQLDTAATLTGHAPKPVDPIEASFERKPLAKFPASVAVVRVQAPGYTSYTAHGWGQGIYSIVTTRDVEKDETVERLTHLPQLRDFAPINRLLIQGQLDSDLPLRQAAAKLQADMVLIYTFDTVFNTEDKAAPLSVVSLGLSPNQQVRVTSTASAVLIDTRNGFVYGVAEATSQKNRMTSAWQNEVACDETRRATETEVFGKLVGQLQTTWNGVVSRYAPGGDVSVR
jgi:hypothetical protein